MLAFDSIAITFHTFINMGKSGKLFAVPLIMLTEAIILRFFFLIYTKYIYITTLWGSIILIYCFIKVIDLRRNENIFLNLLIYHSLSIIAGGFF